MIKFENTNEKNSSRDNISNIIVKNKLSDKIEFTQLKGKKFHIQQFINNYEKTLINFLKYIIIKLENFLNLDRKDDPTFYFSILFYYEIMRSYLENNFLYMKSSIENLIPSPPANYSKSDSSLETFYFKVFPYIELLSLIMLLIVMCVIGKNIFLIIFGLNKQIKSEKTTKESVESKPIITVSDDNSKQVNGNLLLKLKGRKKRNPMPVNYNELFKKNRQPERSEMVMKTENFVNSKKMNDNPSQNQQTTNIYNKAICSIDDLFDEFVEKERIQSEGYISDLNYIV